MKRLSFFLIGALCLLLLVTAVFTVFRFYDVDDSATINVADEEDIPLRFDISNEANENELNIGNKLYHISNLSGEPQIQFKVMTFSDGNINTFFASDWQKITDSDIYYNISVRNDELIVSQITQKRKVQIIAQCNLSDIPTNYQSVSYSWLEKEMEIRDEIYLLQYICSNSDLLSTVDVNEIGINGLLNDPDRNGFIIALAFSS